MLDKILAFLFDWLQKTPQISRFLLTTLTWIKATNERENYFCQAKLLPISFYKWNWGDKRENRVNNIYCVPLLIYSLWYLNFHQVLNTYVILIKAEFKDKAMKSSCFNHYLLISGCMTTKLQNNARSFLIRPKYMWVYYGWENKCVRSNKREVCVQCWDRWAFVSNLNSWSISLQDNTNLAMSILCH